jgi:hypothetical protein
MNFHFKVNNSKPDKEEIFYRQIHKIIKRIKSKYNLEYYDITFLKAEVEDDFIKDRFTLRISFK